jgi:hypothetical protein
MFEFLSLLLNKWIRWSMEHQIYSKDSPLASKDFVATIVQKAKYFLEHSTHIKDASTRASFTENVQITHKLANAWFQGVFRKNKIPHIGVKGGIYLLTEKGNRTYLN